MSDCTVYIDESGDLGVNAGTQWFVLTAVIVKKSDEPAIRATIDRIRQRINVHDIHFSKTPDFGKRSYIVRELCAENFVYMNVLVDTRKFDVSKIPTPMIAYNFVCKYLLERVSAYLTENVLVGDIVLSARGTSRDGELISYISEKLLPYPHNHIYPLAFGKIIAMPASSWDMLQLADVCAATTFLTYEINKWGFCVPCYSMMLSNHLYRRNDKITGYGIKFFQTDMSPDLAELRAHRMCAKKERTPGATAT